MRRPTLIVALAVAGALALAPSAVAETIEVTSDNESGPGSLEQAILDARQGDVIEIPAGEYTLTFGDFMIDKGLTLRGAGEEATTIVPSGGGDALDHPAVTTRDLGIAEGLAEDDDDGLETKVQIVAIAVTLALFVLVLELVRRRRLAERYALLWLSAAVALLVLSIWRDGLDVIANAVGIADPANAIFILALGVTFFLLLHFSVATSRLAEEAKILAQEVARLDQELRAERSNGMPGELREELGEPSSAQTADQ